ncbi:MAG TPA: thiolase family protein [Tepidisphaeraceae bacterium]|nr:thiolase family protein [Tepidisphaeraceae bacterium]
MSKDIYLSGGARTPIGTFQGAFDQMPAPALGGAVIRAALARSTLVPDQIDEVIFGNVIGAGLGQNVARQCAIGAGLSPAVGATTINKVCGSGLKAVMLAAQAIACGEGSAMIAGGTENMSRAPYLLDKARGGYRMGNAEIIDAMIRDGLWDVYGNVHMGTFGDRCAAKYQFTRQNQDDFASTSFKRALAAQASGAFKDEIVPVEVVVGKNTITVSEDENPKKFNEEKLRQLRPAFGKDGTITAGNASSVNDGAAAVVVLSGDRAKHVNTIQARILGYATASREPEWFTIAPVGAISRLLDKLSLKPQDVDLYEINEAFSVVAMAAMKDLSIPHEKVNVNGGAVALGHPIGASGARVLVTLIHAMKKRKAKIGVVSLCIGGGEAVAMAIENV